MISLHSALQQAASVSVRQTEQLQKVNTRSFQAVRQYRCKALKLTAS